MNVIPKIKLVFVLTKNDSADFDRTKITQCLDILPTTTAGPTVSKGSLNSSLSVEQLEKELPGLSIITSSQPYKILKHAHWSLEMPVIECSGIEEPLDNLKRLLYGKEFAILALCKNYNLSADLIVRVYAESNNMPDISISKDNIAFLSATEMSITFDFCLD